MHQLKFDETFRSLSQHKNPGNQLQSQRNFATLGSGRIIDIVRLPKGEDLNEWLAMSVIDFANEITLIWRMVSMEGLKNSKPGEGFPRGFEYKWSDRKIRRPIRCSGTEYVARTIQWVTDQLNDETIFPKKIDLGFSRTFKACTEHIFSKLFRVYAIVYSNHFDKVEKAGAAAHLNTSFKYFLYYAWEFSLLDPKEFKALPHIVGRIRDKYNIESGRGGDLKMSDTEDNDDEIMLTDDFRDDFKDPEPDCDKFKRGESKLTDEVEQMMRLEAYSKK